MRTDPHSLTRKRLDALADRLVVLLNQSSDPQAEMREAAQRLFEAGLTDFWPNQQTTPFQFAETVIADNPNVWDLINQIYLPENLRTLETPSELISLLMPTEFDRA